MKSDSLRAFVSNWRAEIGLALLCLFLFCWRLGDVRLFDLDEGLYVSAARNMALTGDYITPRLNTRPHNHPDQTSVPFFEKPILVYWVSAACLRVFGISEGAARLPVAAASLITTFLVVCWGSRWFGRRAGLLAGLVYATVPMTVLDSRQMTTDALLVLWIVFALIGFVERRPILFWVACALAVLTKGIVVLLPGFVIGAFGISTYCLRRWKHRTIVPLREARRGRFVAHLVGVVLFLCITIPWHVAIAKAGGRDPNNRTWVQEYIGVQHIGRFKGVDKHHNAPAFTYVAYFLAGFFPWACFAPFALLQSGKLAAESAAEDSGPKGPGTAQTLPDTPTSSTLDRPKPDVAETRMLFLKCWFWTIFLFFSASAAKLPTYIVPMYPAAALLVGVWLDRQMAANNRVRAGKHLRAGATAAILTAGILLLATILVPIYTRIHPIMPANAAQLAQVMTSIVTVGCISAFFCFRGTNLAGKRIQTGIAALAGTMVVLFAVMVGPGYALANKWVFGPYQDLAIIARADASRGIPVVYYHYGDRRPSMLYYAASYSPLERKEIPLLPFLESTLGSRLETADVITLRSTYEEKLGPELDAGGWTSDLVSERDTGLAHWYLLRIHRHQTRQAGIQRMTRIGQRVKIRPIDQ